MISLLRCYLYWSVLWGFLAHPALGLKSLLTPFLMGMDLLIMVVSTIYIVVYLFDHKESPLRLQIYSACFACVLLITYGLTVTTIMGGAMFEAAIYIAALLRPMLILIAVATHILISPPRRASALHKILRVDLLCLVGVQLVIATLQIISPTLGGDFIPSLNHLQSAIYALDEGDVSGTFANTIDLAYFLIASYIALTQRNWTLRLAPPILLTGTLVFYVNATGSLAATICLLIYVGYLWLRSLPSTKLWLTISLVTFLSLIGIYINLQGILWAVVHKVDDMMLSRLGLIFSSIPNLYVTSPNRLLTGSGADFNSVLTLLNSLPEVPLAFTYEDGASVINDVFWVALLLSFGAPVAFFFIYRMAQLFKVYLTASSGDRQIQNLVWIIWLVVFLAGMLNQILMVRPFTLTLTLGLLPLALASFHSQHNGHTFSYRSSRCA